MNLLYQKGRTYYTRKEEPIILERKNVLYQKGRTYYTRKEEPSTLEGKNLAHQKGKAWYFKKEEPCFLEKVYKRCFKGTASLLNNNNLTVDRRT